MAVWTRVLVMAALMTSWVSAAEQPNVLVILSDDQGWGDLSLNGNTNLETPVIDSLARQGAQFDRFYVCPVCSPTRAEFLTGRYHPRSGVYSTSSGGERMDLDEITIADTFRAAGYRTAAFGKWHNGMQYPYHPCGRGFDDFYGFCSGHWGDYFSPPLERNGRLVQGNGFCIDDFTEQAMQWMQTAVEQGRPFFAYLPYNTPHSPMQVPDSYWDRFKDHPLPLRDREAQREDVGHTRAALAMCENIDWNVGRLLATLERLQIAEDTIVVYFCDNGPNGRRWNGDMKGRKGATDEGGVRSPLIVRWPGHIRPGIQVREIAAAIDLLPTLAELANVPLISQRPLDGTSVAPLLLTDASDWPNREIVTHWNGRVSVRNSRYRLDHQGALFDMQLDPGQRQDVAAKWPDVVLRLSQVATAYRQDVLGELPEKDERPLLIGHDDFLYTQLPARDATTTGGIQRSNKFPNCSFFTNWTAVGEKIQWDVQVAKAGTYRVEIYYTCPAEQLGATVELSLGSAKLRAQVDQAWDPVLRGGEHDRVPRSESYVKDFRAWELGTLELEAGRGSLDLSAIKVPAGGVMDFRLLMLTRVD